jgi:hypothetical protein
MPETLDYQDVRQERSFVVRALRFARFLAITALTVAMLLVVTDLTYGRPYLFPVWLTYAASGVCMVAWLVWLLLEREPRKRIIWIVFSTSVMTLLFHMFFPRLS